MTKSALSKKNLVREIHCTKGNKMEKEGDEHQCYLISIRINSEISILHLHNAVSCHYRDMDLLPLFILLLT